MANNWYFPSNNFGTVSGIGDSGIETYKGTPYRSLAREVCQNSMDARFDKTRPVIVEFNSFTIAKKNIPSNSTFYHAVNSCLEFWGEQKNKKTVDFFQKAKDILDSKKIEVLRISDFNTTGLVGSDMEFNTPWHNLVKASGVSDKSGTAGGSFGIGKSAPFACSALRTLFYATYDMDGLSASQGIARLVSFREKGLFGREKDTITSGTGYYASDEMNSPIKKCISLDPDFTRSECGTDIFILGFEKESDYKQEVVSSILEEFIIAIFRGDLVVKIDGTVIDKNSLRGIIEVYKSNAKTAFNYYQVLTDKNTKIIQHTFPDLGSIELRILIKQGMHRKVLMSKGNGMKVFDKDRISRTIQFAGICILVDDNINAYFREMENPEHDAWEPERHSTDKKTKAKKNKNLLFKYVKTEIISLGKKTTVDALDAEGVGEYLADTEEDLKHDEKSDDLGGDSDFLSSGVKISLSQVEKTEMGHSDEDYKSFDFSSLDNSEETEDSDDFEEEDDEGFENEKSSNTESSGAKNSKKKALAAKKEKSSIRKTWRSRSVSEEDDDTGEIALESSPVHLEDMEKANSVSFNLAEAVTLQNVRFFLSGSVVKKGVTDTESSANEKSSLSDSAVQTESSEKNAGFKENEKDNVLDLSVSDNKEVFFDTVIKTYTLIFAANKSFNRGYLEVFISGEQIFVDIGILKAVNLENNVSLKTEKNRIYLDNIKRQEKNKISFSVDYAEDCTMEVKLYGYTQ